MFSIFVNPKINKDFLQKEPAGLLPETLHHGGLELSVLSKCITLLQFLDWIK